MTKLINLVEHDDVDPDDVVVAIRTWAPGQPVTRRAELTAGEVLDLIVMLSGSINLTYAVDAAGALVPQVKR